VDALSNRIIFVAGPANITPLEAVRTFERASGRSFTIEHIAEAALLAKLRGATNPLEETFAAFMLDYANGCAMDIQETIAILPRRLASLE